MRRGRFLASGVLLLAFQATAWSSHKAAGKVEAKGEGGAAPGDVAAAPKTAAEGPRPQMGPRKVELGDELVLDLPEGMGYFDRVAGKQLMEKMGNQVDDSLRGLVFQKDSDWLMVVEYAGDGYVKDDDAADLKPDEILKSIKEGTEEANEYRKKQGFRAVHVGGWSEAPHYEKVQHHLIWGIEGKHDDGTSASVNFYTRVLGRRGYVALNLIDDPTTIEASKVEALTVLKGTTFKPGARYEDFNSKSDKVAEYGLAALVLGGAGVTALKLAKIGLLAKFGGKLLALIIAGKKLLVLFVVGVGAWLRRLFGGRKQAAASAAAAPPSDAPPPTAPPPPDVPPAA